MWFNTTYASLSMPEWAIIHIVKWRNDPFEIFVIIVKETLLFRSHTKARPYTISNEKFPSNWNVMGLTLKKFVFLVCWDISSFTTTTTNLQNALFKDFLSLSVLKYFVDWYFIHSVTSTNKSFTDSIYSCKHQEILNLSLLTIYTAWMF